MEEHRLRILENRVPKIIFGLKRDDTTRGWKKNLHNEKLHNFHFSQKDDGLGGLCSTHKRENKCIQSFGMKTWTQTNRKTREDGIVLKLFVNKQDDRMWTGFNWLRTGTSERLFLTQ
jgi:hypothetical protein